MSFIPKISISISGISELSGLQSFGEMALLTKNKQKGIFLWNDLVIINNTRGSKDLKVSFVSGDTSGIAMTTNLITVTFTATDKARDIVTLYNAQTNTIKNKIEIRLQKRNNGASSLTATGTQRTLTYENNIEVIDIAQLDYSFDSADIEYITIQKLLSNGARISRFFLYELEDNLTVDLLDNIVSTKWYFLTTTRNDSDSLNVIADWVEVQKNKIAIIKVDITKLEELTGRDNLVCFTHDKEEHPEILWTALTAVTAPGGINWAFRGDGGGYTITGFEATDYKITPLLNIQNNNGVAYTKYRDVVNLFDNNKMTNGVNIELKRFSDWLVNEMDTALLNLLKNNKVLNFSTSLDLIRLQLENVFEQGGINGGIALLPGSDTEYDYSITLPEYADLLEFNKEDLRNEILRRTTFKFQVNSQISSIEIVGNYIE